MSVFRKTGVRCDWCGKFANNRMGEYTKPDGRTCGYIRRPDWHFNDDRSEKPEYADSSQDICEECAENLCPFCASDQVVKVTPATPGPYGWGGRCKACGKSWGMPTPA